MQKLTLTVLFLLLFIFGCDNTPQVPKSQVSSTDEHVEILIENHADLDVYKFEYDRHQYICFHGFHEGSIIHDPDCKCGK